MNTLSTSKNSKHAPASSSSGREVSIDLNRIEEIIKTFDHIEPMSMFTERKPQELIAAAQSLREIGVNAIDSLIDCLSTLVPVNRAACAAVVLRFIRDIDESVGTTSINEEQKQDTIEALNELLEAPGKHRGYSPQYEASLASLMHK